MALYFPTKFIETTEDPYCPTVILTLLTSAGLLTRYLFVLPTNDPAAVMLAPTLSPSSLYPTKLKTRTFVGCSQNT